MRRDDMLDVNVPEDCRAIYSRKDRRVPYGVDFERSGTVVVELS